MRRFLASLMVWAALVAPAAAYCDTGRPGPACATDNGHYRIRLPEGGGPFPAVLYLYGSTGRSGDVVSFEDQQRAFTRRGYALIVPAALDLRYGDGGLDSGWHLRHERMRKPRDEIGFLAEVLQDAEIRYGIDRRRVLMAGMSRGGFLTWETACHRPDLAAAFAPIAAGYMGPIPSRCDGPVRLLHTHGRADPIVPIAPEALVRSGGALMSDLDLSLATVGRAGGCGQGPGPVERFREYDRTTWQGCAHDADVQLLVHDGGHDIPLSWYGTVIDWFEEGARPNAPIAGATGGGSPRFERVDPGQTGLRGAARAEDAGQTGLPGTGTRPGFKRAPGAD